VGCSATWSTPTPDGLTGLNGDILVADEDGTRGLSVCAAISGFPILADGRRQVTLPEDEAAWTAARWIDGAELPIKDENDE